MPSRREPAHADGAERRPDDGKHESNGVVLLRDGENTAIYLSDSMDVSLVAVPVMGPLDEFAQGSISMLSATHSRNDRETPPAAVLAGLCVRSSLSRLPERALRQGSGVSRSTLPTPAT